MPIPVFIITRDRVSCLKQCLEGYKKLGDVEIVIHDNNSTYPPMVEYLKELETQGIKVYYHPVTTNDFNDISQEVANTIKDWYKTNDSPYYIVTDPDIELENPSPELLEFYIDVMKQHNPTVVGCMLRIDDLPDHFVIRDEMVKSHMIQFWGEHRNNYIFEHNGIKCQRCAIDTTFGLYKKEFEFKRLNHGIRVYEPYMARHLDWYLDTNNLSEEQQYYIDHCNKKVSTLSGHITRGRM